jgi:hypothetical protein
MPIFRVRLRKVGFHERLSIWILMLDMGSLSPHLFDFAQGRVSFRKRTRKEGWGTRRWTVCVGRTLLSVAFDFGCVCVHFSAMPWFGFSFKPKSKATDRSVRPTYFLSHTFPHISYAHIFTTVRARATDNLRVSQPSLGERGFGECIPVSLRSSLAFGGRDQTILPARLGRSNLEVC